MSQKPIHTIVSRLTPTSDAAPLIVKVDDSARLKQIRRIVEENNRSSLSDDLIICQIYMESRFDANAGAVHDARGLMQMQNAATKQVFKYRLQKRLGRMPSDLQSRLAFHEGAALHDSAAIFDEAINVQLGTEYMQYWIDMSPSIEDAYKRYRGRANGVYYRKISVCAEKLRLARHPCGLYGRWHNDPTATAGVRTVYGVCASRQNASGLDVPPGRNGTGGIVGR